MDWTVIYCKPQHESRAESALTEQGFTVYLPQVAKESISHKCRTVSLKPLFPRYLFVKMDEQFSLYQHQIKNTRGVNHVLRVGETIITASDDIVNEIQNLEQDQRG